MDATEATIESAPPGTQAVHALHEVPSHDAAEASDREPRAPRYEEAPPEAGAEAGKAQAPQAQAAQADAAPIEADLVGKPDRRKLEEQLEALKRKEFELRRALSIADHPDLADAIRALEGRAYAIQRAETKLAQGLSKSEERRRETIEKKLASLREKRAELDAQIGALELEQQALGAERAQAFEAERRHALEQLLVTLGTHEPAFRAAGLEATELVPELTRYLPEIQVLAESLVAARDAL